MPLFMDLGRAFRLHVFRLEQICEQASSAACGRGHDLLQLLITRVHVQQGLSERGVARSELYA